MQEVNQAEKTYDYIVNVTITQGRLLSKRELYGDGSIHGFDKETFEYIYATIKHMLKGVK